MRRARTALSRPVGRTRTGPQGASSHTSTDNTEAGYTVARLYAHGRVDPRPGVASASNLVPKSATSDGDKAKGPALPVAVFGKIPWQ